jgi:hypothetical protein
MTKYTKLNRYLIRLDGPYKRITTCIDEDLIDKIRYDDIIIVIFSDDGATGDILL